MKRSTIGGFALALVPFAAIALVRASYLVEGDTFWGVRAGQTMVARHSVHLPDNLSWTRSGVPWHPNEWGYDVALWLAYRVGGMVGMQLLVAATIVLLGGIMIVAVRAFRGDVSDVFWIGLFFSPLMLGWVSARAQTVSYSMQLLDLLLLAGLFGARGRMVWRWAVALVVVQVLWVNIHEAALSGAVVAAAGAAVRGVTLLRRRELSLAMAAQVAAGPVLVLVGSLGSPFGWRVFADSEQTRSQSAGVITEWRSIVTTTAVVRAEVVAGLVLLVLVAVVWRRARGTPLEALADVWLGASLVLAVASVVAVRFVAPLMLIEIVALFPLVRTDALAAYVASRRRMLSVGAAVVALALVVVGVRELTLADEPTAATFPSADLVREIPAGCILLNDYNDGGWISFLRGPALKVSQDGRNVLYGKTLLEHEDALLTGRLGASGVIRFGATCVLAKPSDRIVPELAADPGWTLSGSDSKRVLYVRRAGIAK